jgi:hypothetical protein
MSQPGAGRLINPAPSPYHHHTNSAFADAWRNDGVSDSLMESRAVGYLTAGPFVPWVVRVVQGWIVVARIAGRGWGDPFFQFFDLEFQFIFHSSHLLSVQHWERF